MSISILDNLTGRKTTFAPEPRRRRRRGWGTYIAPIERRTAGAADMCLKHGWSVKRAASVFTCCAAYINLAKTLTDSDRAKLARGELRMAALWRDYRRRLAERRAQAEAAAQAEREAQARVRAVDGVLTAVGLDRVVERIVTVFGPEPLMAALDRLTAPPAVAAE
jgi:hypothetical protein